MTCNRLRPAVELRETAHGEMVFLLRGVPKPTAGTPHESGQIFQADSLSEKPVTGRKIQEE
jgi:hypothetical protein